MITTDINNVDLVLQARAPMTPSISNTRVMHEDCYVNTTVNQGGKNIMTALWSVADVAAYLKVRPQTVYLFVRAGKLPALRISRRCIRFEPQEIVNFLRAHRQLGKVG